MAPEIQHGNQRKLSLSRLVLLLTLAASSLLFASPAEGAFTRYSRASGVTGGPGAYQTSDNPSGTVEEQLMTLNMGDAVSSSSHTEVGSAAYTMGVIFVSDALAAERVDAGTWTVHSHAKESNAGLNAYLRWYIYKWSGSTPTTIAGPSEHANELTTADKGYSLDMAGTAVSFSAGDRLVVEVYFRIGATSGTRTTTLYWGMTTPTTPTNTDDDGWITGPGSNVPTLGWPLFLAAVTLFTLSMTRKGKLSQRLGPATALLLSVLLLSSKVNVPEKDRFLRSLKQVPAVSIRDPGGKTYQLRPVAWDSPRVPTADSSRGAKL